MGVSLVRVPPRASGGHLLAGLIVILCAYLVSALLMERLFKIVKPKLLTLSWFVIIWRGFNFPAHRNLRVSEGVENLLG